VVIRFRERMTRAAIVVTVLALAACGGSSGSTTSSGTPASTATAASVAPAAANVAPTVAFLGRWKIHGGPPGFSSQYDLPLSGVGFSNGGKGYWQHDGLQSGVGMAASHRVTGKYPFTWRDMGNGKIRITQHATATDYTPTVESNELTLAQDTPGGEVNQVFDRVGK